MGSVAHLTTPHLWSYHEVVEFKGLGSSAHGFATFKQHTSVEASTRPMHDRPEVVSAALRRSPTNDKAFRVLTYTFLSHLYSFMFSACLYNALMDVRTEMGMYPVEVRALLMIFRWLPDFFAEALWLQGLLLPCSIDRAG